MQTYSHAIAGATIAQVSVTFFGSNPGMDGLYWGAIALCAGMAGAILPDVPYALYMVYHTVRKTPVSVYAYDQGWLIMTAKEASHSLFVWGLLLMMAWNVDTVLSWYQLSATKISVLQNAAIVFVFAGILGGVVPDIPTHVGLQYKKDDCTYLWGMQWLFRWCNVRTLRPNPMVTQKDGWFVRWVKRHLLAEYRIAPSVMRAKDWEISIDLMMWIAIIVMWIFETVQFPTL